MIVLPPQVDLIGTARTVLIGLLAFLASRAIGQGAVNWVFIGEICPNRVRARELYALDLRRCDFPVVSEHRGKVGRPRIRVLHGMHGGAVAMGGVDHAGSQGRLAGGIQNRLGID